MLLPRIKPDHIADPSEAVEPHCERARTGTGLSRRSIERLLSRRRSGIPLGCEAHSRRTPESSAALPRPVRAINAEARTSVGSALRNGAQRRTPFASVPSMSLLQEFVHFRGGSPHVCRLWLRLRGQANLWGRRRVGGEVVKKPIRWNLAGPGGLAIATYERVAATLPGRG